MIINLHLLKQAEGFARRQYQRFTVGLLYSPTSRPSVFTNVINTRVDSQGNTRITSTNATRQIV